jgi:hypothetical protein
MRHGRSGDLAVAAVGGRHHAVLGAALKWRISFPGAVVPSNPVHQTVSVANGSGISPAATATMVRRQSSSLPSLRNQWCLP